jgi:hypothetical protein
MAEETLKSILIISTSYTKKQTNLKKVHFNLQLNTYSDYPKTQVTFAEIIKEDFEELSRKADRIRNAKLLNPILLPKHREKIKQRNELLQLC